MALILKNRCLIELLHKYQTAKPVRCLQGEAYLFICQIQTEKRLDLLQAVVERILVPVQLFSRVLNIAATLEISLERLGKERTVLPVIGIDLIYNRHNETAQIAVKPRLFIEMENADFIIFHASAG